MKRFLTVGGIAVLAASVVALSSFGKVVDTTYGVKGTKCSSCHTGKMGGKLNPFGTDLGKALGGAKKLTPEILKKIEDGDSDKDGVKNGEELKKGKNPGGSE